MLQQFLVFRPLIDFLVQTEQTRNVRVEDRCLDERFTIYLQSLYNCPRDDRLSSVVEDLRRSVAIDRRRMSIHEKENILWQFRTKQSLIDGNDRPRGEPLPE